MDRTERFNRSWSDLSSSLRAVLSANTLDAQWMLGLAETANADRLMIPMRKCIGR